MSDDAKATGPARFTFDCIRCGACCHGNWYERDGNTRVIKSWVLFTEADVERVCQYLQISESDFMTRYAWDGAGIDVTGGACPFFDPVLQCTIHPAKPTICREFPHPDIDVERFARICPGLKPIRTQDEPTRKIPVGKNPKD